QPAAARLQVTTAVHAGTVFPSPGGRGGTGVLLIPVGRKYQLVAGVLAPGKGNQAHGTLALSAITMAYPPLPCDASQEDAVSTPGSPTLARSPDMKALTKALLSTLLTA